MKKALIILSIISLLLPLKSLGQTTVTVDDINYELTYYGDVGNIAKCIGPVNKKTFSATNLEIPKKVKGYTVYYINEDAFKGCTGIEGELIINEGVEWIDNNAFYGCTGITSVKLPLSLKKIYENAFYGCEGLTGELNIPDGVQTIYASAFRNCSNITSLILGRGLRAIGYCGDSYGTSSQIHGGRSFSGCSSLQYVKCLVGTPPNTNVETGNNFDNHDIPLYVDEDFIKDYKGATSFQKEWSQFTNIQAIQPEVTQIILSVNNLSLKEKEFSLLTFSVQPENGDRTNATWTSEHPEIATVQDGLVTGIKAGQTIVTVSIGDVSANCVVTVTADTGNTETPSTPGYTDDQITAVVFMVPDEDKDFSTLLPTDATASSWESSNDDIAEVNKRGRVDAWEFGRVYIVAKDDDGSDVAVFEVNVCPTVTVEHPEGSVYVHHVLYNSIPTLNITPAKGYVISGVTHDSFDVTDLVTADGTYVPASPITADTVINLALLDKNEEDGPTSGVGSVVGTTVKILVYGHQVNVIGAQAEEEIKVYNMLGHLMLVTTGTTFTLEQQGVYLIKIQDETYKIVIN